MNEQLNTPIAIIVFKRLDATKEMFETVRAARPRKLFIIADGWRNDDEKEKCFAVREYLDGAVDWSCEVYKNYSDINIGLKKRIVSGLDWVFEAVETAIILEDDCIPDASFFPFCEELLEKYKDDPRIMHIAGMNFQQRNKDFTTDGKSYYFSHFGEIWGWATWRRAWKLYDVNMSAWPKAKKEGMLQNRIQDPAAVDYFEYRFDFVYDAGDNRKISDVWGAQWLFTQWLHDGLAIVPVTNLVSNLGVSPDATHQKAAKVESQFTNAPTVPVTFPLVHPADMEINQVADAFSLKAGYRIKRRASEKVIFFLKRHLPALHAWLKRLRKA
ncbi:glycosyltransferase family 2 protein [Candidatus Parcubacteria bacterium]|nr:glycosyltransferase family 2 protein [Candidatus Parcubacteria bacterium]